MRNQNANVNDSWWCSAAKCYGCEHDVGGCEYNLEEEEELSAVAPGTYTNAKYCPYYDSAAEDEYDSPHHRSGNKYDNRYNWI